MDFKLMENDALNVLSTITGKNTEWINDYVLKRLIAEEIIYHNAEMSKGLTLSVVFNDYGIDDNDIKTMLFPNIKSSDETEFVETVKGLKIVGLYLNEPKGCDNCGCEMPVDEEDESINYVVYRCTNEVCDEKDYFSEYDPHECMFETHGWTN